MRIIAGSCRGRRLKTVRGFTTRPTADRVKEAIFNVLGEKIIGSKVLDLFAGTGNIGIEALSRGAQSVFFVEKDRKALQVLKTNVRNCGFQNNVDILAIDAFNALKIFKNKGFSFNLVYLDPPYKLKIIEEILELLINYSLLVPKGIVITETSNDTELKNNFRELTKVRTNIYGDTKITYYQIS